MAKNKPFPDSMLMMIDCPSCECRQYSFCCQIMFDTKTHHLTASYICTNCFVVFGEVYLPEKDKDGDRSYRTFTLYQNDPKDVLRLSEFILNDLKVYTKLLEITQQLEKFLFRLAEQEKLTNTCSHLIESYRTLLWAATNAIEHRIASANAWFKGRKKEE